MIHLWTVRYFRVVMMLPTVLGWCLTGLPGHLNLAQAKEDWLIESTTTVTKSWALLDPWRLTFEEAMTISDLSGVPTEYDSNLGLSYRIQNWGQVSGNYRLIFTRLGAQWLAEQRPHLNLSLTHHWRDWQLVNRSRFEWRWLASQGSMGRYRQALTLDFPWEWTVYQLRPYAADEIFVEADDWSITAHEPTVGVRVPVTDQAELKVFYRFERRHDSERWQQRNRLGLDIQWDF